MSPILFLFFNADLVQRRIDSHGGAIASSTTSLHGSQDNGTKQPRSHRSHHPRSPGLGEKKRCDFRAEKTAIIHFTHKAYKTTTEPFTIKGRAVQPKYHVKILGVIMDAKLKYKEHIARAASKGLEAAMALRRLRGVSPLDRTTVVHIHSRSVVDYASNVWMHAFKGKLVGPINRVQRIGAQAIVATFLTVATSVAEAEAHIAAPRPVLEAGQSSCGRTSIRCPKRTPFAGMRLEYANSGSDTARHFTRWQTHSKTSR